MRNYPAPLLALLDAGRVAYAGMILFELGQGAYGFIQKGGTYTFGGVIYQPLPRGIIGVSSTQLSTGTSATGFQVTLSESTLNGITPEVIYNIENYDYRDRRVTVFDLHTHPDTGAVLGDPVMFARGYINVCKHDENENGHILTMECEDRGMDMNRTNASVRTNTDHQSKFPGDKYYEHASTAARVQQKVDL
jgi:hypothetical protein